VRQRIGSRVKSRLTLIAKRRVDVCAPRKQSTRKRRRTGRGVLCKRDLFATVNSESVAELVEEGQDLEAEKVSSIEDAPDPDEAEVTIHGRRE
jgi:hypothetical protein